MLEFIPPQRKVTRVFLHCSASDNPDHDDWKVIDQWHKENSWDGIGYHYFITSKGVIQEGRDLELQPAAQKPHNKGTIAICTHGLKHFSEESLQAVYDLCKAINEAYHGEVTFHGHREVEPGKTCPVYDYKKLLGLDEFGNMPF
jgi:N-acetyl-anhydromuramyl-L-alanine amidase AmpD